MASTSQKRLRSGDDDVFLVGKCDNRIVGAKLPSIKQVLQVFFYYIRYEKCDVKTSAGMAIDLVLELKTKRTVSENWRRCTPNGIY